MLNAKAFTILFHQKSFITSSILNCRMLLRAACINKPVTKEHQHNMLDEMSSFNHCNCNLHFAFIWTTLTSSVDGENSRAAHCLKWNSLLLFDYPFFTSTLQTNLSVLTIWTWRTCWRIVMFLLKKIIERRLVISEGRFEIFVGNFVFQLQVYSEWWPCPFTQGRLTSFKCSKVGSCTNDHPQMTHGTSTWSFTSMNKWWFNGK